LQLTQDFPLVETNRLPGLDHTLLCTIRIIPFYHLLLLPPAHVHSAKTPKLRLPLLYTYHAPPTLRPSARPHSTPHAPPSKDNRRTLSTASPQPTASTPPKQTIRCASPVS